MSREVALLVCTVKYLLGFTVIVFVCFYCFGWVCKIMSLFEFQLQCCNCGRSSDTYEPLIDLSLEIEDVDTLPSALESFTKVERIEDSGAKFMCENCKEEVLVEKQFMLDQAPSVAAFHLKRFKTDGQFVEKVDKHVEFPLELDLQPYSTGSQNNNVGCRLFVILFKIYSLQAARFVNT